MSLSAYIEKIGDAKAAKLFGVKIRTVASWRRGERIPQPKRAAIIVRASRGVITLEDIFMRGKRAA